MILILQAAYKVINIPEHTCYDIGKDYIIPLSGSVIAFIVAYWVFKIQFNAQKENDKQKVVQEKEEYTKLIKSLLKHVTLDIENNRNVLSQYNELYDFNKYNKRTRLFLSLTCCQLINDISQEKIYWSFSDKISTLHLEKEYFRFLVAIKELQNTYNFFENFLSDFLSQLKEYELEVWSIIDKFFVDYSKFDKKNTQGYVFFTLNGWFDRRLWQYRDELNNKLDKRSKEIKLYNFMKDAQNYVADNRIDLKGDENILFQNIVIALIIKLQFQEGLMKSFVNNCDNINERIASLKIEIQNFFDKFK